MNPLRTAIALSFVVAATAAQAAHAADFAACFTLKPGVAYMIDDDKIRISRERFGDREAIAMISSAGVPTTTYYDPSGRALLGSVQYGIAGDANAPVVTERYAQTPEFPATAKPGAKFKLQGKGQRTLHGEGTVENLEYPGFDHFTFVGFEDLELPVDFKKRKFPGTCRLKAQEDGLVAEFWYAPGFGRVKFVRYQNGEAQITLQLDSILSE